MGRDREKNVNVDRVLSQAKALAKEYYELTGKPLGITGEVAEVSAAKLLDLELAEARQSGFDATGNNGRRFQIKGRRFAGKAKVQGSINRIRLDQEWDAVLLVLLREDFEADSIWEANRDKVEEALKKPGSTARNTRGVLSVKKFKEISKEVWSQSCK